MKLRVQLIEVDAEGDPAAAAAVLGQVVSAALGVAFATVAPAVPAVEAGTSAARTLGTARTNRATGTKALILEVLSDGLRHSAREIAQAAKVARSGTFNEYLAELVTAGDIRRVVNGRSTSYMRARR